MTILTRHWPRSGLVGLIGMPLLLLACLAYFWAFSSNLDVYGGESGLLQYTLNVHDHLVYVSGIDRVRDGSLVYEVSNDLGIAMIYAALASASFIVLNRPASIMPLLRKLNAWPCSISLGAISLPGLIPSRCTGRFTKRRLS